jgi:anti-sigma B factor antagonist
VKTKVREVGNIAILEVKGKIMMGEGDVQIRDEVKKLIAQGKKNILVDLGEVTMIDSSGLGELVGSFTSVTRQGGKMKLLKLAKRVHDLLQITRLYTVFEVFDDEAKAVKSFEA